MKQLHLLLLLSTLLLSSCGYTPPPLPPEGTYIPPELNTTVTMQDSYTQGSVGSIDITVSMTDPDNVIPEAVFFLNVVKDDDERTFPQAAQSLFNFAEVSEDVFRVVHSQQALKNGFDVKFKFKLKNNAPIGQYKIVIQLFRGRNTNPNTTNFDHRIDQKTFGFRIMPSKYIDFY